MRVTSAFCRLLRLEGVWVRAVVFDGDRIVVRVALLGIDQQICVDQEGHCSPGGPTLSKLAGEGVVWKRGARNQRSNRSA